MSTDNAIVRPARPEDAAGVAQVHIAGWQEAYAGLLPDDFLARLPESFDRRRQFWEELARSPRPGDVFLVAEVDSGVVGFVHAGQDREDSEDGVGEVTAIYLRKAQWGQGVGRRLFSEAVEGLKRAGFETATLWVLDTNRRARRFYEAAGWTTDGTEKQETLRGVVLREVRYRTRL